MLRPDALAIYNIEMPSEIQTEVEQPNNKAMVHLYWPRAEVCCTVHLCSR